MKRKAGGLFEADLRRRLAPSATTLAGLLKHVAAGERSWFQRRLAGLTEDQVGLHLRGDDQSWIVRDDETLDDLIAEYDEACARSREIAGRLALDDSVPHERLGRISLRWVYVHMIEETARHAGHADILREQIDASTGG